MPEAANTPVLLPIYLIVGDDALKVARVLERLTACVAQAGPIDFNLSRFSAETADFNEVVADCNTVPFGGDKRLVILEGADKITKDATEILLDYLRNPAEICVLAICAKSMPKNSRIRKAVDKIGKDAVIECKVDEKSMPGVVAGLARDKGLVLEGAAAARLATLIGPDTVRADTELEKLAVRYGTGARITVSIVEDNVERAGEPKPWDLTDAMAARDTARVLRLLDDMSTASPYALIAMCTNRIRDLIAARDALDFGGGAARLVAEGVVKSDYVGRKYLGFAKNFTAQELREALYASVECEQAMKSGTDPKDALQDWLIGVCIGHKL
jgi:DNA polymerase-3 subunit delta